MSVAYTGPVTIADDETVTGTGLARAIFDAISVTEQAYKVLPSLVPPPTLTAPVGAWTQQITKFRLRALKGWARQANAHALANSTRRFTTLGATGYVVQPDDDVLLVPGATLGANSIIQLPAAAISSGRKVVVKTKVMGGFNVAPQATGSDIIDGLNPVGAALAGDWKSRTYLCDGVADWYSIGEGAF